MGSTLKELAIMYAKKQPKQVDTITEDAPILNIIPFVAASHGLWNAYEDVTSVTGASFVDMDAPLPTIAADSDLKRVDLGIMGGNIECGEDKAKKFGGFAQYLANKIDVILRQSGSNMESSVIYDNFRQYAIDKHTSSAPRLLNAGGSSTGYSMLAVRFVDQVTCGLYDAAGFGDGAMFDLELLNAGALHTLSSGINGYAARLKTYLGIQIADVRTVAAIVNIDATHVPTATQIDDLLDLVRSNSGTYLFCHPKVLTLLNTYRAGNVTTQVVAGAGAASVGVQRKISSWNEVPFVTSYQFLQGTEANVTVS